MRLEGKIGMVVGAGRGIGRAAAVEAAREGADMVLVSRSPAELESTANRVRESGRRALAVAADIGNPSDVDEMFIRFSSEFGRLDFLMNTAAILGPLRSLLNTRSSEFDSTIRVNLCGAFTISRRAAEFMIDRQDGSILHLTSGLSRFVMPCFGAYGVSKAGLEHMVRFLAAELKEHGIRVNALDPGSVDTPMQEEVRTKGAECLGRETLEIFLEMKKKDLLRKPEEVASCMVALVSDGASRVTGHIGTLAYFKELGVQF
jgi:NAD(P)-dependent dehydrogenase (short-subunit alcohol dehydrogenase family)